MGICDWWYTWNKIIIVGMAGSRPRHLKNLKSFKSKNNFFAC